MATIPKAEVFEMAALVEYQTGAIVSRQVSKSEGGNVTLFAFDEGQGLSEHSAPFDALVHVLDGEAEIRISGRKFLLQSGQAILLPANEPHAVQAVTRFKMLLTMLKI